MRPIAINLGANMKLFFYSFLIIILSIITNINAQTVDSKNSKKEKKSTTSLTMEDKDKVVDYGETVKVVADQTGEFSEGLCPVMRDNKWGFINTRGQIVIEPK